jgi:integrin alpha FG-GAP repeat containing protein 1
MDMIFTTCQSVTAAGVGLHCAINVVFNEQLPLCTSTTDNGLRDGRRVCRPPGELCTRDANFRFNMDNALTIPLTELFGENGGSMLATDTSFSPTIPLSLKIGDANLDGFPDLLLIHVEDQTRSQRPKLLFGTPCSADGNAVGCREDRGGSKKGRGKVGFTVATKKMEALDAITDARGLAFLDMDEDVSVA